MGPPQSKIDPVKEVKKQEKIAKKQKKIISMAILQIERELKKNEADDKKTLKLIKDMQMATKNQHVSLHNFFS